MGPTGLPRLYSQRAERALLLGAGGAPAGYDPACPLACLLHCPPPAPRLILTLLRRRGAPQRLQRWGVALWLFSPFTATISTRGNGEAVVTCMLLGLLLALDAGTWTGVYTDSG